MSGGGAVLRAARVRFKPRAAAVFGAGYTNSVLSAIRIDEQQKKIDELEKLIEDQNL